MSVKRRLFNAVATGLSRLPWCVLYGISSTVAWLAYSTRIYRYKVVDSNLRMALPELSGKERCHTIRCFYRHLTDTAVQTLKLLTISDEKLRQKVEFIGFEQLQADAEARRSVVLYLGHYGNWELVPTITWVIPPQMVCAQIYRPGHDEASVDVMHRIRHRFNALNIPQQEAFRTLLRLRNEGKISITGFIADQRPNGRNLYHWTDFLGLRTAYNVGGEEIGRRIGATYYYIDVEVPRRGYARFSLVPIVPAEGEDYPYTVAYLHMLEQTIRRAPAYWLWSHKRWAVPEYSRQFDNTNNSDKQS